MNLIRVGDLIINMDQVFSVEQVDKIEGISGKSYDVERVVISSAIPEMRYVLEGAKARTFWTFLHTKGFVEVLG